jgi:hypothetical protein
MSRDDLKQKVREWLEKEGYPLELKTAAALRAAGFPGVLPSAYYQDPEGGGLREIDVYAFVTADGNTAASVSVHVECKSQTNRPWVFFEDAVNWGSKRLVTIGRACSPRARAVFEGHARGPGLSSMRLLRLTDPAASSVIQASLGVHRPDDPESSPADLAPSRVGGARAQATQPRNQVQSHGGQRTQGGDRAFAALMSAAKAAVAEVQQHDDALNRPQDVKVALPVVVIEAPMFVCRLGDGGELDLHETDEIDVVFRRPVAGLGLCVIRCRSAQNLAVWAATLYGHASELAAALSEAASDPRPLV